MELSQLIGRVAPPSQVPSSPPSHFTSKWLRIIPYHLPHKQVHACSLIVSNSNSDCFSWYYTVAPGGHVSPEREQVSSPGSCSSTHLEEHDDEDDDDDDDDDATAIDTEIQSSEHEEVPIETVLPPNRPSTTTYDAIVASEGKIVEAENRRHSDLMTVLERMIALQEETISQLAHLHRVFIEVPKQLQKINTSFEALVVQQTQANYLRMTTVPHLNFNTSQAGSLHAGNFSPHASELHSPGPNVTAQVADIAVQVPDDILPLPSVQNQELTPTKEATKTKHHKQLLLTSFWTQTKKDTHETDQPSLVQCLPTCSHVSVGTSPVGESLPKSPVGESLPKSPVGEQSLPKSPVGEQSLPKSPVGEQSLPKSPVVAPGGHVSPETKKVSSPGTSSSSHLEEECMSSNGSATSVPSETIPAAIAAPSIPEGQMQDEHNYSHMFPNLFGQDQYEWENNHLPPDILLEEGSGDSYERLMEICDIQDSTVASTMDENAVSFWSEQLQPNQVLLLEEW
ncbi:uncharacterized protein LOC142490705 [Ascaphus truei]|uniref:uncharacterized protein LOC142490705 n=1 Tax=Ascaphus truei TaxID=8439 RepID=UPI003F594A4F